MRTSTLAIVLLLFSILAPAGAQDREDDVVITPKGDPEMEAARRQAKATLNSFFKIAREKPAGTSGYKVKVKFDSGRYTEHLWVDSLRVSGSGYQGILVNEPKYAKYVQLGQLVTFKRADISDWGYVKNGRQVGSFTVCAMFKRTPKEQADYFRKTYGFDC